MSPLHTCCHVCHLCRQPFDPMHCMKAPVCRLYRFSSSAAINVSVDTCRVRKFFPYLFARMAYAACARAFHVACAMFLACVGTHALYFHAPWHVPGALRLVSRGSPISTVLGKRSQRPPAIATAHAQHARIIVHSMSDMHAVCHAVRAHVMRMRGRPELTRPILHFLSDLAQADADCRTPHRGRAHINTCIFPFMHVHGSMLASRV